MSNLIQNLESRRTTCNFQQELHYDMDSKIRPAGVITQADKTSNFMSNIAKCYEEEDKNKPLTISSEDKSIATGLNLADRINCMNEN